MFSVKSYFKPACLIFIVIGSVAAYTVFLVTGKLISDALNTVSLFLFSGLLYYYAQRRQQYQFQINCILTGIFVFLGVHLLYVLARTYLEIPEWDFVCFYLFGKVGISNSDFYNPQVFSQVFNDLNLHGITGSEFKKEIVDVGFWYPPPAMLLFLVLGLFNLKTGYLIWQTIIILFLVTDIFILYKKYCKHYSDQKKITTAIFPIAIIILLFPGIEVSVYFSQTISIFLFLLLLLMKNSDNWKAGLYLALLIFVKPIGAFFILYFIIFKQWKTLVSFLISGAILVIIAMLFFGYQPFIDYFLSSPANRMPESVFYEKANHSLNAVLLRMKNGGLNYLNVKAVEYFVGIVVLVTTVICSKRLHKISPLPAFLIYIPMALMLYPGSLISYSILLLPVILWIYHQKLADYEIVNILFILVFYIIGLYSLFWFNLAVLLFLCSYSFLFPFKKKSDILKPIDFLNP